MTNPISLEAFRDFCASKPANDIYVAAECFSGCEDDQCPYTHSPTTYGEELARLNALIAEQSP